MTTFLIIYAFLISFASGKSPIVIKGVTELGPQVCPDVTHVSRDGGYSVLLDGHIVWLYDDTECLDSQGKQLSFVSNTAAYVSDPNRNISILQDFGVQAVGKDKKTGETDTAILANTTVATGGWINFSPDEVEFNEKHKGVKRVAIWPGTSPTPYSLEQAYLFAPLVYVDSKPRNPSKRYQARGMTLISITTSSTGPAARRQANLIIPGKEVAYGGFSSLLAGSTAAKVEHLRDRDVYLIGSAAAGLQLARAKVGDLTDFSKYSFWDPMHRKFTKKSPDPAEKDYRKVYLPGSFSSGTIFYSPYFHTFIMVYYNKFVDSTFRIRFLHLNAPGSNDPVWITRGKHGKGIAAEDVEALVRYGWSPEQELYRSPAGKGGFNYAGVAHPEYWNRQYYARSLYPSGTSASQRQNAWYGSKVVSEKAAGGDGKHLLLSWTSQTKGGFDSGIYEVRLAKVEFGTIPQDSGGEFPSAAVSSSMQTISLASSALSTSATPSGPHTSLPKASSTWLTSAGSADRHASGPWRNRFPNSSTCFGALVGLLLLLLIWLSGLVI
ncbi:MAG: hypothetical protein L6R37_001119 [Teloschistes peruensis]|nr:MAG: hypothetical protein L6R37_001119 [Teloschistes peruensis]